MSDGPTFELPRHVEMAAIDEDIRQCAIQCALLELFVICPAAAAPVGSQFPCDTRNLWPSKQGPLYRARVARALRVLRHFGLLVEHGDGVVSVKETP